jgi:hypothetical protein
VHLDSHTGSDHPRNASTARHRAIGYMSIAEVDEAIENLKLALA